METTYFGTNKSPSINILRNFNYNPIGISVIMGEESFIFKTKGEAKSAYDFFEGDHLVEDKEKIKNRPYIQGWWYEKNEFLEEQKEYNNFLENNSSIIYWL